MCWAPRTCLQYAPCVSTQMVQHTNSTGDIKAELVRQGGRLPEWLIVREREWFTCKKLTFTDWRSLVNGQLSPMHWRVPNRGKLISYSTLAIYVLQLPNFIESSPPVFSAWSTHVCTGPINVWDQISGKKISDYVSYWHLYNTTVYAEVAEF